MVRGVTIAVMTPPNPPPDLPPDLPVDAPRPDPQSGAGLRADSGLLSPQQPGRGERASKLPWVVAGAVVVLVTLFLIMAGRHKSASEATANRAAASGAPDAYAANMEISKVQMSESTNFAGGKVTYVDGEVANKGAATVDGVTVSVTFRNDVGEPPQVESMPLSLIRTREPYVDIEPVSAEPLTPGAQKEFRLIFDHVTPNWNQQFPAIAVVHTHTK